jgi:hypothetical protein
MLKELELRQTLGQGWNQVGVPLPDLAAGIYFVGVTVFLDGKKATAGTVKAAWLP